jgi:hypothetical protein
VAGRSHERNAISNNDAEISETDVLIKTVFMAISLIYPKIVNIFKIWAETFA